MNMEFHDPWTFFGHVVVKITDQYNATISRDTFDGWYIGKVDELNCYGWAKSIPDLIQDLKNGVQASLKFLELHPEYVTDNQPPQQGKK